ncbi:hypothetical protein [Confluentibacter lentus]|uniref:hypothetical protein n=1 Tax=Confluentibacter lentus TaxID=1699412 RepID=UPI000C28B8D8|nr:hypothetical protein [Confluentibacter lentus]
MRTYTLILVSLFNAMLLIGHSYKDSHKTASNQNLTQTFDSHRRSSNDSFITVNGITYNLISDPCVLQINDDLNILTFKAVNNDMDYSLTVNLGAFNSPVDSGNYIYSSGETQANFAIITLVTENGTFVNTENNVVNYTKNGMKGEILATNISLMDHFETLPNMLVSFRINCTME